MQATVGQAPRRKDPAS